MRCRNPPHDNLIGCDLLDRLAETATVKYDADPSFQFGSLKQSARSAEKRRASKLKIEGPAGQADKVGVAIYSLKPIFIWENLLNGPGQCVDGR